MKTNTAILGLAALGITLSALSAPSFAAKPDKPSPEQRAESMIKRMDTDKDGKVSLAEAESGAATAFATFDADRNGQVTRDEIKARREAFRDARKAMRDASAGPAKEEARAKLQDLRPVVMPGIAPKMFEKADADKNGSLSLSEVNTLVAERFKARDRNSDGFIDASDMTRKI